MKVLRSILAERGRDPASFPIGKRVYLAIDRDRARAETARRVVRELFGRPALAEEVSVWGDVDDCVEGLRAVAAAGSGFLMLNPVFDEAEQLERIAADLAPRL
jgi:alkanesulfonate monooxygenase SsuD/methylene tetrahydromethanopterin reductase-like flavin-dependent oxidoreductase (luciferase family)